MLPFTVHFVDGVPVSDQILQAVRKALLTGRLRQGDGFPSVRQLSQDLRISPTTAHKVVGHLKQSGFLASRPGIGMVVVEPLGPVKEERMKQLKPLCRDLIKEAADLHLEWKDLLSVLKDAARDYPQFQEKEKSKTPSAAKGSRS